jgi:hypothetical protein
MLFQRAFDDTSLPIIAKRLQGTVRRVFVFEGFSRSFMTLAK